jgi:hypothetical protein
LSPAGAGRIVDLRKEGVMQASVGDRIVAESNKVDAPRREGEIIEVRGADGAPPYVVRWSDGHEGLTYPGPDAHVVSR